MDSQVETQEIWIPCEKGQGQAIRDGQNLMLAAIIANGHPVYLAKDILLEKVWRPEPTFKAMQEKFNTTLPVT